MSPILLFLAVIGQILLMGGLVLVAFASASNRGGPEFSIAFLILGISCIAFPIIAWLISAKIESGGRAAALMVLTVTVSLASAVLLPGVIVARQAQTQSEKFRQIAKASKIDIVEETSIERNGKTVGIRLVVHLSIPHEEDLKPILNVAYGLADNHEIVLMRTAACGTLRPPSACRVNDADHQSAIFWSHEGRRGTSRELYFELAPAAGDSAKWLKQFHSHRYVVPKAAFDGVQRRLVLHLSLVLPMDSAIAKLKFSTQKQYDLRQIFINAGAEDVMKALLSAPNSVEGAELGRKGFNPPNARRLN